MIRKADRRGNRRSCLWAGTRRVQGGIVVNADMHCPQCSSTPRRVSMNSLDGSVGEGGWTWRSAATAGSPALRFVRRQGNSSISTGRKRHRRSTETCARKIYKTKLVFLTISGRHRKTRTCRAFQSNRWRPQGDSNPSRRRERAVSWASRRWGRNFGRLWWSQRGSNSRPLQCHCSALPAELWPLNT